jgi:CheY-like chemotaxis protein/anti-sigma regulatory factor (Ser/Thr protein kinase)
MNAILGISEIQLRSENLSEAAEEGFRQIYDSGNLLLNIINDILDFSKIDAGKLEIILSKYDIPSLINDTVQLCTLRYDESKPIEFIVQVDENTPLELIGDELRIKQILNNLLSNAFKYTNAGKVTLSAALEPEAGGETGTLVFKVSDTGQGMSKEQIVKIFDEYARFNMEENKGIQGTGLGMPITNRLVSMMGGGILVESEPDKGTVVTVRLPQKTCGPTVCGAELVENLKNFSFNDRSISHKAPIIYEYMPYGRVLIVDDIESNLYVARGMLAPYELNVETAHDGIEAVEKIKSGNIYDLVLMDHMMPRMDGIQATEIIRGMGYDNPIVALTANAMAGQAEKFLSLGFDRFIPKPIDTRELDIVLTELIRDRNPPEIVEAARRERRETVRKPKKDMSELVNYFIIDAGKIIPVLENVYAKLGELDDTDIQAFTTAVHGIKNALRNIGEIQLSEFAFELEQASEAQNFWIVADKTPVFIKKLKILTAKLMPKEIKTAGEVSPDNMLYLKNKLSVLESACESFDRRAAKTVLGDLQGKKWPDVIDNGIDEISACLLRGEFKKAASIIEEIKNTPQ